eukprot:TRINITY_DN6843_c0_g1_i1.p1 TRINITY_DN6843_c0_g1~~TRINITY_DN6843_c0_g1_i1.p1  ORF type:complete len:1013 (+),score=314.09 TRINITY_DN6843_c0_g1_i1:75-3041(+)
MQQRPAAAGRRSTGGGKAPAPQKAREAARQQQQQRPAPGAKPASGPEAPAPRRRSSLQRRGSGPPEAAAPPAAAAASPAPPVGCVLGGSVWLPAFGDTPATVRYLGPSYFGDGEWIGLQLQHPLGSSEAGGPELLALTQRHCPAAAQMPRDGSVGGTQYFACPPGQACFLRRDDVSEVPPLPPKQEAPPDPETPGAMVARPTSLLAASRARRGSGPAEGAQHPGGGGDTASLSGWRDDWTAASPPYPAAAGRAPSGSEATSPPYHLQHPGGEAAGSPPPAPPASDPGAEQPGPLGEGAEHAAAADTGAAAGRAHCDPAAPHRSPACDPAAPHRSPACDPAAPHRSPERGPPGAEGAEAGSGAPGGSTPARSPAAEPSPQPRPDTPPREQRGPDGLRQGGAADPPPPWLAPPEAEPEAPKCRPLEDKPLHFGDVGGAALAQAAAAAEAGRRLCAAALEAARLAARVPGVPEQPPDDCKGPRVFPALAEGLPQPAPCPGELPAVPLCQLEGELRGMQGCSEAASSVWAAASALAAGSVPRELHPAWAAVACRDAALLREATERRAAGTRVECEAHQEAVRRAVFAVEEAEHTRDTAIADGDVAGAERAYRKCVEAHGQAQAVRERHVVSLRDGASPDAEKLVAAVAARRRDAREELGALRAHCEAAEQAAEQAARQAAVQWEAAERALLQQRGRAVARAREAADGLERNAAEADGAWQQIAYLVGVVQRLEESRRVLAAERAEAAAQLAAVDSSLREAASTGAQERGAARGAQRQAAAAAEATANLRKASQALLDGAEEAAREHKRAVFDAALSAHTEHMAGHRAIYLLLGDLRSKKEHHLLQIEGRLVTAVTRLGVAAESLDPAAKDHAKDRDELLQLREKAAAELAQLEAQSVARQRDFALISEGPLRAAGREVADPEAELKLRNDGRAGKIDAYRQLLDAGDPDTAALPWRADPLPSASPQAPASCSPPRQAALSPPSGGGGGSPGE